MKTFNNGEKVVPCVVVSEPDAEGVVQVFAAEGSGDAVKVFNAKAGGEGSDYERA
jgi:hypothetical protein